MTSDTAEYYIKAAEQHGQESEPDHEVGDLQTLFRAAFELLTDDQRKLFGDRGDVGEIVEFAINA